MAKVQLSLTVSQKAAALVEKQRNKKHNFNFSAWVEAKIKEELR